MIERNVIQQKLKEYRVEEYVKQNLKGVGHSSTRIKRTPLGEKIIITASRPGLVVGRKGQNIKKLTKILKSKFKLENPEIEINEIKSIYLDVNVVAELISNSLEKFGTQRFKGVGHRTMFEVMKAGALGIEILISGKIPGSRAKTWRFAQGYLKKSGDIVMADDGVKKAYASANLKTGVVGIQVRLMLPNIVLPDSISIKKDEDFETPVVEDVTEVKKKPAKKKAKKDTKEAKPKKSKAKEEKKPKAKEEKVKNES